MAALLLARRHNRLFRVVRTALWIVIILLAVVYGTLAVGDPRYLLRFVVVLVAAVVLVLERWVLLPMRARRIFRQQRAMQEPFVVRLGDDGVEWESAVTKRTLPWDYYVRCVEGPEHFLLYQSDWSFEILPKRLLGDRAEIGAFRQLLFGRLHHAAGRRSRAPEARNTPGDSAAAQRGRNAGSN